MHGLICKILREHICFLLLFLCCNILHAQVEVIQFNAGWNAMNNADWCHSEKKGLSDCEVSYVDIGIDKEAQSEFKVVVVPTIIIFNEGEEVKRYQADLSFKLVTTKEELQEFIDELIMSDF
jgi:hypothetical protein